jgi:hypothetical protein
VRPARLLLLVLVTGVLVAACTGEDTPLTWTSPFQPLLLQSEREAQGSCDSAPGFGSLGCTPNLETGVCVPSPTAACAASAADPPCVACAKASCCIETLACYGAGTACGCLVQARTDGAAPACSASTSAGKAYEDESACLAQHCAACPAFREGT